MTTSITLHPISVTINSPSIPHIVPKIVSCSRLAFDNDPLDRALVPNRSPEFQGSKAVVEFRENRTRKRLEAREWHFIVAVESSEEGKEVDGKGAVRETGEDGMIEGKVIGYAGWMSPPSKDGNGDSIGDNREAGADTPHGVDREAFAYANEVIGKVKKEVLEDEKGVEREVWYLASLAVDPSYQGRGVASQLVSWGIEQANVLGLPTYLEASPAAVGLYRRLGYEELRKVNVIRSQEGHVLTVMLRGAGDVDVK